MTRGLLVVNAFLKSNKFDELYRLLLEAARGEGMELEVQTNAEVVSQLALGRFSPQRFQFCIFWDKDVELAMQLETMGLRLFNRAQSILDCDDKGLTYLRLREAGVPMPETVLAPKTFPNVGYTDLSFLDGIGDALGFPTILKERFGSFGMQVYLCRDREELSRKVQELAGTPLLFQKPVMESLGRDIRLNVVGGRVVASILRESVNGDFRSNLTIGGRMRPYQPTLAEEELALRAVRELGLDFAGVDVLFGKDGPLLCEVNSNAHFKTTLQCTGVNMASEVMRHIAAQGKEAAP